MRCISKGHAQDAYFKGDQLTDLRKMAANMAFRGGIWVLLLEPLSKQGNACGRPKPVALLPFHLKPKTGVRGEFQGTQIEPSDNPSPLVYRTTEICPLEL